MRIWILSLLLYNLSSTGCARPQQAGTSVEHDNKSVVLASSQNHPSDARDTSPPLRSDQSIQKAREQVVFNAEDAIQHPVGVPAEVLQLLRRDERNRTCLEDNQSADDIPPTWFTASEIDLNNDKEKDLIVKANNPCLFGANIDPFWVFRKSTDGYELVLRVHTLSLEVLDISTRGYRDIRTQAATAKEVLTTMYKFDGNKYKAMRSWREPT